jgi:hypothetical protein
MTDHRWRRTPRRFVPAPIRRENNSAMNWDYTDRPIERREGRWRVLTNWHTAIYFVNKRLVPVSA